MSDANPPQGREIASIAADSAVVTQLDVDTPNRASRPESAFKQDMAGYIFAFGGGLFAVVIIGCVVVLYRSAACATPANPDALETVKTILTTSIGFFATILTTVVNHYFQHRD